MGARHGLDRNVLHRHRTVAALGGEVGHARAFAACAAAASRTHAPSFEDAYPLDWPETLTGRPRQAYEFWRDQLRPAGYRLKAMIVEWPGGLPGDVGFFLQWGEAKR